MLGLILRTIEQPARALCTLPMQSVDIGRRAVEGYALRMTREMSLTLLGVAATTWALVMVVGGLWLMSRGIGVWHLPSSAAFVGSMFWIASGELLFMCLVADRWFPRTSRVLIWPLEIAAVTVMAGCIGWSIFAMDIIAFGRALFGAGVS